jgi:hypothetical protein
MTSGHERREPERPAIAVPLLEFVVKEGYDFSRYA